MFTVHVVTAAVDTRCGRATTSRERTEVLDYIMCDWLGEKSEKGVKRELKSAITATEGARASSMTSQRQAHSVSFELLFLDSPLQNLYSGLKVHHRLKE